MCVFANSFLADDDDDSDGNDNNSHAEHEKSSSVAFSTPNVLKSHDTMGPISLGSECIMILN